jgi:hypothetical protein
VAQISIFLSHSGVDKELAERLAHLFQIAFRLHADEIRCSSADGYKIFSGDTTDSTIQRELNQANVLVGLITPASLKSQYVLFELGARWGGHLPLRPLLARGVEVGKIGAPLANLMFLRADEEADLMQFLKELAEDLNTKREDYPVLAVELKRVIALARAKDASISAVREICMTWADEFKEARGDLYLLPTFLEPADAALAFIDCTEDDSGSAGIIITAAGIVWKNSWEQEANRNSWKELAHQGVIANKKRDRLKVGTARIDLSGANYNAVQVAALLTKLAELSVEDGAH